MNWVSTWLTTRIDLQVHSVEEEDVTDWTRLRRSWLKPYPKYIFTSWSYFIRLYASFDGLWQVFLLPKLLLYLRRIGLIGLELNSEGKIFSFICCGKQRTILLDVPRAWRVLYDHRLKLNFGNVFHMYRQGLSSGVKSCYKALNGIISLYISNSHLEWRFLSMITTCDLSANIYVACSTSLVTRGSCLSHSKLELQLTNFRLVLRCLWYGMGACSGVSCAHSSCLAMCSCSSEHS